MHYSSKASTDSDFSDISADLLSQLGSSKKQVSSSLVDYCSLALNPTLLNTGRILFCLCKGMSGQTDRKRILCKYRFTQANSPSAIPERLPSRWITSMATLATLAMIWETNTWALIAMAQIPSTPTVIAPDVTTRALVPSTKATLVLTWALMKLGTETMPDTLTLAHTAVSRLYS